MSFIRTILVIIILLFMVGCAIVIIDSNKDNDCRKGLNTSVIGSDDNVCEPKDKEPPND